MELNELKNRIGPPDLAVAGKARLRWGVQGDLGALEEAVIRVVALTGNMDPMLNRRALLVFCADNGVALQGIGQSGTGRTAAAARALAKGESTVCHMARAARCAVQPVDMGILDFPGCKGLVSCRIRNASGDISQGPAMNRDECLSAIRAGAGLAMVQAADVLAVGETGFGSGATAAAVSSILLGMEPEQLLGRNAELSEAALIRKAIDVNKPDPNDPVGVLAKVGGLDLAAMCGAFLGAAVCRVPAIVDGAASAAAALCASRLFPEAKTAMLASHISAEPAFRPLIDALGLRPMIDAGLRLGEGSGAVAALPLLDLALAAYHSTKDRKTAKT